MENFPLANLADGLISYLQYKFSDIEFTPSDYRWNRNDRESRIIISGPFVVDQERTGSSPYVIVERGNMEADDRVIDNLKKGTENVYDLEEGVMMLNGGVSITIGSGAATEASNLANFIMILLQSDRHSIMAKLKFLRNFKVFAVSEEQPQFKDSEVKRWKVVIQLQASLQMGWINKDEDTDTWEQFSVKASKVPDEYISETGVVLSGSNELKDPSANFGLELDNTPQLLSNELSKGWYSVQFEGSSYLHMVESIKDSSTLVIKDFDPAESSATAKYKLIWNAVHLHVGL